MRASNAITSVFATCGIIAFGVACGRVGYEHQRGNAGGAGGSAGATGQPPEASCGDGVRNGGEVDIDCGTACGVACILGSRCGSATDCASAFCSAVGICARPTCTDGEMNGDETGLDCGGSCTACGAAPLQARTWQTLAVAAPGRLVNARLAFYPGRGTSVLYGGSNELGNTVDESWEFNGTGWSKLCGPCPPGRRTNSGYAYDSQRGVIVMYGGLRDLGGTELADLWEFNGTSWQSVTPGGTAPPALYDMYMAYDANRHRVVIFGGFDAADVAQDKVYEYDGTSWYGPFAPTTRPSARGNEGSGATFAPATASAPALRNRVVIFGSNAFDDDFWGWDGTAWTRFCSACTGIGRTAAPLIYEPTSGHVLLINGWHGAEFSGTWEYADTVWQRTSNEPTERDSEAVAFDEARNRVVIFGGNGDPCQSTGTFPWDANCGETLETTPP